MYNLRQCVTNWNHYNSLYHNKTGGQVQQHAVMLVCTADYVILSLQCFLLIKGYDVQNFELVLSHKHKLACFTLIARDERKE